MVPSWPWRRRVGFSCVVVLFLVVSSAGRLSRCVGQEVNPRETRRVPGVKVVHVFVALCDNKHQGIVPVPEALGNGQDPKSNLYWGAQFGADTFFRNSKDWTPVEPVDPPERPEILAWSVFVAKAQEHPVIVVMCAYDGRHMKAALTDFLGSAAGLGLTKLSAGTGDSKRMIDAGGRADMVCFVGHNGLMDMKVESRSDLVRPDRPESAVVLACRSYPYFKEPLRKAKCRPLITTTGLMSPEAYTLDAIIRSWAAGDEAETTCDKAAAAYAKYQKCSVEAAKRLFIAGWGDKSPPQ